MTTHYLIHSPTTGRTLKATYSGGIFSRLEKHAGKKMTYKDMRSIGVAVPATEAEIEAYKTAFPKLCYNKLEKKESTHQKYVSAWYDFYNNFMKIPPRFNAVDGVHIKQIKTYLARISDQENEGLELFQLILDNWHKLDDFHKENTDLKYINSRINPILNAIKKAGHANSGGADNSVSI